MELNEDHLIHQAKQGDVVAFEQLVRRFDKQVLSIALSQMRNEEDAKDIYQEVFIRVFRALPKFRMESKFSTWLHRIAINVCLTHKSQRKRFAHASLDEEVDGFSMSDVLADKAKTDQQTMSSQISQRVEEAMGALSPQQKMVFTLRHYEGYKLKEIALVMNCAEGTIKKYLFTATVRLREQLQEVF